jgi:hypothetical protein
LAITKKDDIEKHEGSKCERLDVAVAKGQLARCACHTTYADQAAELGRHDEEGLRIGNKKFQILERAIGSP